MTNIFISCQTASLGCNWPLWCFLLILVQLLLLFVLLLVIQTSGITTIKCVNHKLLANEQTLPYSEIVNEHCDVWNLNLITCSSIHWENRSSTVRYQAVITSAGGDGGALPLLHLIWWSCIEFFKHITEAMVYVVFLKKWLLDYFKSHCGETSNIIQGYPAPYLSFWPYGCVAITDRFGGWFLGRNFDKKENKAYLRDWNPLLCRLSSSTH